MIVTWLVVALVVWPLLALAVGVLLGRGMAAGASRKLRIGAAAPWIRRELPSDIVAPLPGNQDFSRI
jgi:hypothetical protein